MAGLPEGLNARLIDYRQADERDLERLHVLEMAIRAETRPQRKPFPFDRFLREARALPSNIDETTWIVEASPDAPVVATASCWHSGEGHDPRVLEITLHVGADWRRRGIGTHLLGLLAEVAGRDGRSSLVSATSDSAPAGEAFARAAGAAVGMVDRESTLELDDVDWEMVRAWVADGPRRAQGYHLEFHDGVLAPELHPDLAAFEELMETAPRDDLDLEPTQYSVEEIAAWEAAFTATPELSRWMTFVRHDASGACVGGTNVFWEPHDPEVVAQGNTGVHPDHRGHALGKWLKAEMLERIRRDRPEARRVRTTNAYSNDPMLGINDALGFKVIRTQTQWQLDVAAVTARP